MTDEEIDKLINGICIGGKFYEVVIAENYDFHKCKKCALIEFCDELAPFPCAEELSDPKDSNMHYYHFSPELTERLNGKSRGKETKRMCHRNKSKVCDLCHECDIDISQPTY